jgi:hypothetical protein
MAAKWGKKGKEAVGSSVAAGTAKPERISNTLGKVLVAESAAPSRKQRIKKLLRQIKGHRRFKPIAVAVLVLVIFAGVVAYLGRDKEQPIAIPEGPKCSYSVLEKAKPNFDPKNVAKLEPQIHEIEKIPGYDEDPNCLYVSLTYYINISDAAKSREVYDKLTKVYVPSEGYETVIVDVAKKPDVLKPNVEFLEQETARYENIGPDGAPR